MYEDQQIGFRLLTELIIVQGQHPDVYADIVRLHADGLKALAVQEPDVRDLLIASSGVYHPAGSPGDDPNSPPRGSRIF